ncbi:MAG: hypothetical protein JWO78_210 [Micavibrio sp.]|nr:hypothetical protein [Micavibrio sp.]
MTTKKPAKTVTAPLNSTAVSGVSNGKNPYALYEIDKTAEVQKGVPFKRGEFSIFVKRAGGGNKAYTKCLAETLAPVRQQLADDTLPESEGDNLMAQVFADTIIVGWENVRDRKGKPLAYTRENVVMMLTDLPELFRELQAFASNLANFRKAAIEADSKNSVKS